MKRLLAGFVLGMAVLVSGCASGSPTKEELAGADYGGPMTRDEAQMKARAFLRGRLNDPMAARYQWGAFNKGWVRTAPGEGGEVLFGQRLDAKVDAHEGFGVHTGFVPYIFLFKNGELIGAWGQQEGQGGSSGQMERIK
jgi:hypothetical protein